MRKSLALGVGLSLIVAGFAVAGGTEEGTASTTATMSTGKYNEAPMLAELVAAGELPPVDERLPDDPKVKEVVEEIGQYGGTINAFAINMDSWNDMGEVIGGSSFLLDITPDNEIVPDLAAGYELAPDGKSMTLSLRPGTKWSDGHPFTADDIVFMFEDMHWNDEVSTWNLYGRVNRIRKIDDYTVQFEMDNPYPVLPVVMVTWPGGEIASYAPKHYLKKWHIKYNEDAEALAKEEGFDNWWEAFNSHQIFYPTTDTNQPTTMPWEFEEQTATVKYFKRNPYFYQVDPAGNQLPYIDDVVVTAVNKEVYQAKIMSGESDIAVALTSMENYSLYKENEQAGGYRVIAVPGVNASEAAFSINQNHPDPALREIFNDVRFRRALSTALNRDEINETVYFGLGTPRQATTLANASFYKPEWGEAHPYLAYDPDDANELLDEMGLTARDADGFRLVPGGDTLVLLLEYPESFPDPTMFELMKEYWEDVGLKIQIKGELAWALFGQRTAALDHMIMVHPYQTVGEIAFLVEPFPAARARRQGGAGLGAVDECRPRRELSRHQDGGRLRGWQVPGRGTAGAHQGAVLPGREGDFVPAGLGGLQGADAGDLRLQRGVPLPHGHDRPGAQAAHRKKQPAQHSRPLRRRRRARPGAVLRGAAVLLEAITETPQHRHERTGGERIAPRRL